MKLTQGKSRSAPKPFTTSHLDKLLWCGHHEYAKRELHTLIAQAKTSESRKPLWKLARWNAATGNFAAALNYAELAQADCSRSSWTTKQWIFQAAILAEMGCLDKAKEVIDQGIVHGAVGSDFCLIAANSVEADAQRLDYINKIFIQNEFATLAVADPKLPLNLNNLSAASVPTHPHCRAAKVSVIVPAFNAAETLPAAIRSILAQSWANLELLLVDDGSADGTWALMESFAASDARIRLLRHHKNEGAYHARNTGLAHATGDLVTVHDSDDWSHPQKIAVQADHILNTRSPCNTTNWVRTNCDLRVRVRFRSLTCIHRNIGSLMANRAELATLGGWDEPRFAADDELCDRLRKLHKADFTTLGTGVPLTFALVRDNSLTARGPTGLNTLQYGARKQYQEAYQYWHDIEGSAAQPNLSISQVKRPFPLPNICAVRPPELPHYDVVHIADFAEAGTASGLQASSVNGVYKLRLKQALIHWPSVENADLPINKEMRSYLHRGMADLVVPGEHAKCDLVLFTNPQLLLNLPNPLPRIDASSVLILLDQLQWDRDWLGKDVFQWPYSIDEIKDRARAKFGVDPILAPFSQIIRSKLSETGSSLSEYNWMPFVEAAFRNRRIKRPRPCIGVSAGRDWKSFPRSVRNALKKCGDMDIFVLGGAPASRRRGLEQASLLELNIQPAGIADCGFTAPVFSDLDFFAFYPPRNALGRFELLPIEAMAAGVPVILPPALREVYGDAAVYSKPGIIEPTVHELWNNKSAYEEQVTRGELYLNEHCSLQSFARRLKPYLSTTCSG